MTDMYYNKAKQEGYRSRAAYKLLQLDEMEDLFGSGDVVVDLGAAPGGWMQVAGNAVGPNGTVVGIDFQRIDPIEDNPARCISIQGDITEASTIQEVRGTLTDNSADVVLSDMAPDMTGEYSVDQARSVYLAERARTAAVDLLAPGGHFVVKVFQGKDVEEFRDRIGEDFDYVRATSPDASRERSAEIYLIGNSYRDPPIATGDRLEVEIVDEGAEGDGITRVEGYTVFVPKTETGEQVRIEITDTKAKFGFARRLE